MSTATAAVPAVIFSLASAATAAVPAVIFSLASAAIAFRIAGHIAAAEAGWP